MVLSTALRLFSLADDCPEMSAYGLKLKAIEATGEIVEENVSRDWLALGAAEGLRGVSRADLSGRHAYTSEIALRLPPPVRTAWMLLMDGALGRCASTPLPRPDDARVSHCNLGRRRARPILFVTPYIDEGGDQADRNSPVHGAKNQPLFPLKSRTSGWRALAFARIPEVEGRAGRLATPR